MHPMLLVAIGGATGASARWVLGEIIERDPATFPWATFVVNIVGCLAIGLAARRLTRGSDVWLGLVIGLLGGLTTFSAFAVETRDLVDAGHPGLALVYVASTVSVGVAATEIARAAQWSHR